MVNIGIYLYQKHNKTNLRHRKENTTFPETKMIDGNYDETH